MITATCAVAHVGRVPPAAHADLDHRDVHRRVREGGEHHAGEDLEEGHLGGLLVVDQLDVGRDLLVKLDKALGGQRLAVHADPLPHRHQVRRGEPPGPQPALAQQRLDHPRGRGLAVGPGDVHDRERTVRVAEQADERGDPVKRRVDLVLRPPRPDLKLYFAQPLSDIVHGHQPTATPQVGVPVVAREPRGFSFGVRGCPPREITALLAGTPAGRCPPRPSRGGPGTSR